MSASAPTISASWSTISTRIRRKRIEENGGQLYLDLPMSRDSIYFEQKCLDPDGVHFDISPKG